MKRSQVVMLVWLIMVAGIVVLWMMAPARTAVSAAKISDREPDVPKVFAPAPPKPGAAAQTSIELPKSAPATPADDPVGSVFIKSPATIDVVAEREAHRRGLEQQIQDLQRRQQKLIDNAATPEEKEKYQKEMEELMQRYQSRREELAGPPPEPLDFGDVALVEGVPVERTLANGNVVSLTPKTGSDGKWKMRIVERFTDQNPYVAEIVTEVPVTPGRPMAVPGDDEQYYYFTPQIIADATAVGKSTTPQTTPAR